MASRPIVPSQPRAGEAPAGGNKIAKKIPALADGRPRRALKEIGNLAAPPRVEGKGVPQRPLTRSFCAQLIANAQAAAAKEHITDRVCANLQKSETAVSINDKKADEKLAKAMEVIQISPDTEVVNRKNQEQEKMEEEFSSRKKTSRTHTSTLYARSKAVIDIDSSDAGNELAAVEYVEDMYKFFKETEGDYKLFKYMILQPDMNPRMRSILVDWLIDVHHKFELSPETLYLTVNIIDRFLAKQTVPRREIQLLGIAALLSASKYEEIWAPEVNDLVMISDRAYSHGQILAMEKTILRVLQWTLTVPTPYVFLVRFIKASIGDKNSEMMVFYLAELGLMNYEAMVTYSPSVFAASAVYVARCAMGLEPSWSETLKAHTGYSEEDLRECGEMLAAIHRKAAEDAKLQAVVRKYSRIGGEVVKCVPARIPLGSSSSSS